jgi:hypothetical protein
MLANPKFEFLVCCGGLFWLVVAFHWVLISAHAPSTLGTLTAVTVVAGHIFGDTHFAATLRKMHIDGWFHRDQVVRLASIGFILATFAASFFPLTPFLLQCFLLAVIPHYTGQAFGLTLRYCAAANSRLVREEIQALSVLMRSLAIGGVVLQVGGASDAAYLTQLFVIIAASRFVHLVRRKPFPWQATMVLFTTAILLLSPKEFSNVLWLYAPALFHGPQYLVIAAMDEKAKLSSETTFFEPYVSRLVFIVTIVYVLLPMMLSFLRPFQEIAVAVGCCVGLHHFVVDARIWKHRPLRNTALARS